MLMDFSKLYESMEIEYDDESELKVNISTTQTNIVLPTKNLIKKKDTDFRVLLAISLISNVENNTLSGNNSRYCSIKKLDRNMKKLCEYIGISISQFRKHIRKLLQYNSSEFRLVERIYNNEKVKCYEINYKAGEFILVPINKAKILITNGSNNCIKLYTNLLWLCIRNGRFVERDLTQGYLLNLMGLSSKTRRIITKATEWLEDANLIETRKEWMSETVIDDYGMPFGSSPKLKIYYSIICK